MRDFKFTTEEKAQIVDRTTRLNNRHAPGVTKKYDASKTDLEVNMEGQTAEFPAFWVTGGVRIAVEEKDRGWEIVDRNGKRVQVKGTRYPDGVFYMKPGEAFVADIGILVIIQIREKREPVGAQVVRAITREDFEKLKQLRQLQRPHGNWVWSVTQEEMAEIEEMYPERATPKTADSSTVRTSRFPENPFLREYLEGGGS